MWYFVSKVISLFYTKHSSFIWCPFLNWNRTRLRWEKGNSIQCPKIDANQCRVKTTHLTEGEGGGGGYGNYGAGTALETEGNFLKYSCERCIQMAFSQWRVAVVVMLSLRKQPFYWGGGGGWSAHFNSRVFCRNFGQIFFIHRWPFSFHHEGCDKKYPLIYRGRGWWRMPYSAKLLSTTQALM